MSEISGVHAGGLSDLSGGRCGVAEFGKQVACGAENLST
jgi:hypothetical protein